MKEQRPSRRDFLRSIGMTAGATVLAGCAPQVVEKVVTATPPPPEEIVLKDGGFLAKIFGGEDTELWAEVWARFHEKHPNVIREESTVDAENVQAFLVQLAAGDTTDIISSGEENPPMYGSRGIFLDLRPFMEQNPDFFFNEEHYSQAMLASDSVPDGGIYALTAAPFCTWIVFNKALFEANGVELPPEDMDDPKFDTWNWDTFLAAAQALTADDVYGVAISKWWADYRPFVYGNGGQMLSDDWKTAMYDSPEIIEAMDFYAGLITKSHVAPDEASARFVEGGIAAMFKDGKIAMLIDHGWRMGGDVESPPDFPTGYAPIPWNKPEMKDQPYQYQISVQKSIYSQSKIPEIAWDLMAEIWNTETVTKHYEANYKERLVWPFAELRTWQELYERADSWAQGQPGKDNANFRLYRQILERSRPGEYPFAFPEIEEILRPAWDQLFAGEATAAEVLGEVNPQIQTLLDEKG